APPSARPGGGEAVARLVCPQAAGRAQLVAGEEQGRGDIDAGGLGEDADDVVPDGNVPVSAVPPHVVADAGADAGEAVAGHVEQCPAADGVDGGDDAGVEVRVKR